MNPKITTEFGALFDQDCMTVLPLIKDGTIDCIFADPPFNLGKKYGPTFNDRVEEDAYLAWTRSWLVECIRVLKPGGSLFVYNLPKWQIQAGAWLISQPEMVFRHWIAISMKNVPPRPDKLYPAHYGLLYFTKGTPRVFNKDVVRVPMPKCRKCAAPIPDWGGYKAKLHPDGVNLTDIWVDTSPVRHKRYKTRQRGLNELDPKIPQRAILLSTEPGDVVLDPFGGGGTTYRVAQNLARYWVGAEIGDCDRIAAGLSDAGHVITAQTPSVINDLMEKHQPVTDLALRPQILEREQPKHEGQHRRV